MYIPGRKTEINKERKKRIKSAINDKKNKKLKAIIYPNI